ncbi:MAG: ABC transporter ATP-binding protein [Patescibacteria group bacterium]
MIKKIFQLLRPFWGALSALTVFVFLIEAINLAQPYYWGKLVDGFFKGDSSQVAQLLWIIGGIMLADVLLDYIRTIIENGKFVFRISRVIDVHTVTRASSLSLGQITSQNSGFRQKVANQGSNALQNTVQMALYDTLPLIALVLVAFMFLFLSNVILGYIVLATVLVSLAISIPSSIKMAKTVRKYREMDDKVGQQYSEILRSLPLILLSAQEKETIARYKQDYTQSANFAEKIWLKYLTIVVLPRDLLTKIGNLLLIGSGATLVLQGSITAGSLVTVLAWANMIFTRTERFSKLLRRFVIMSVDVARYFEIVDLKPTIAPNHDGFKIETIEQCIEFRNVSFSYPESKNDNNALHNISFSIKAGEVCAIVGHSGAGKSTIVNLLLRGFDPQEGEVLVDGKNLKAIEIGSFRKQVGYVEQQVRLWDDTLRANLLFGIKHPELITEAMLTVVAEQSKISSFFDRLPNGFDTKIGENGVRLSGGERQRVAIARALLRDPKLLILDEATNSLDTINDAYIQQAMRDAMKGKTGIIIAHRLSTISHADKIIVMEKGKVAGIGNHTELLASCEQYKNLVEKEGQVIIS